MRAIKLFLFGIMCILSVSCSAQRTFPSFSSIKGVTSVFIGKTMLRLAGTSMDLSGNSVTDAIDISSLMKGLDSIEIIQCDNKTMTAVKTACDEALSKYPFEVFTEVIQDDETVEISGVPDKDGKNFSMLLISVAERNELVYILMKGKIDIETLSSSLINEMVN